MPGVQVLRPGALTMVQDLGRPGLAHLGIPRSGAADRRSLVLANQLVGNAPDSACLETTLVGPRLRMLQDSTAAITGGVVSPTVGDRQVPMNEPFELEAGDILTVGMARRGLRSYVAFRGGIECERWFGSCSTDVLTGLGPLPLTAGTELRLGASADTQESVALAASPPIEDEPVLELIAGPRTDWFDVETTKLLVSQQFRVSSDSNRVGIRLEGAALSYDRAMSLRSEGLAHGALQVPPSGQPILMLADHPTTGGYPVIACVCSRDLSLAAQLRPGQPLRFRFADA